MQLYAKEIPATSPSFALHRRQAKIKGGRGGYPPHLNSESAHQRGGGVHPTKNLGGAPKKKKKVKSETQTLPPGADLGAAY